MSTEKTEGLVIRQADFSETSRVVTWFTRDWGRISTVAKGARRLKGPFDAALDLLTQCRIVFIRKASASLDILTEAQLISRFSAKQKDLTSLYGGYYVAELLAGLTEDYDPHPQLYEESVQTLNRLQHAEHPQHSILRFELAILREIGQLPDFHTCLLCGEPVGGPGPYAFWVSQGGLICRKCRTQDYHSQELASGTIAILQKLTGENSPLVDRLQLSDQQFREIRSLATASITNALGRRPKMLRYFTN